MKSYITQVSAINKTSLEKRDFSLSGKDYRQLKMSENSKPLSSLIEKSYQGKEIGSASYMKHSKYRFLKTVNITDNFSISEESIEYCRPENIAHPQLGDILIAKDGGGDGLGESALYNLQNPNKTDSISAGVLGLRIKKENRYYLLGLLKSKHFKSFVDLNTPQGSTIRHSKKVSLNYPVPFPKDEKVQNLVSLITQNILDKEEKIKLKNQKIDELIEKELKENQNVETFEFRLPKISEIRNEGRLDTALYGIKNKKFVSELNKYKLGLKTVRELGFKSKRGHNLAISVVGTSYYSDEEKKNFYSLVTSTNIDDTRTLNKRRYLGNINKLVPINEGDILFSATGQVETSVGKTYVFCNLGKKTTSNFNSFFFYKKDYSLIENIFVAMVLSWFKHKGFYINLVGKGNGGSFTEYHFDKLKIPNFPKAKQEEIAKEYYNQTEKSSDLNFENYLENEKERNAEAGIFQLNMELFSLREKLEDLIDKIIKEVPIKIDFNYNFVGI